MTTRSSLLGVGLRDLHLPTKKAVECAAALGFGGVEVRGTDGDTSPGELSASGRRHLARLIRSTGMRIAAIDGDGAGGGLSCPARADERVARTKAILDLARDIHAPVITTTLGASRGGDDVDHWLEPLREMATHADRHGTMLAIQPGDVSPDALAEAIRRIGCASLSLCVDPGILTMNGYDPADVVVGAAGRIQLSHARDAIGAGRDRRGRETEIGEGHVDFGAYLAALDAAGYHGPQIIRRGQTHDAVAAIARAKTVLARCE